ncbi:SusC/RagA family TonB-linked outer membrane protein [Larkinella arboricola]
MKRINTHLSIIGLLLLLPTVIQAQSVAYNRSGDHLKEYDISYRNQAASVQTLESRILELEKEYKVSFLFDAELLNKKIIKKNRKYNSLERTLDNLLTPFGLTYKKLRDNFYVISSQNKEASSAPGRNTPFPTLQILARSVSTVTGTVTDAKQGDGLPGVNIILKGTSIGTTSNKDGQYTLSLPDGNGTLVFSYIGFTMQEIPVQNRSQIDVRLVEEAKALSEVVVVGYSTKQLSQLSSSVAVVTGKQLNDVTSNNTTSLLQGKAPGIIVSNSSGDPNATPTIVVRGSSSISAGSGPLYVVDGIIGGNANPNDVESITILKDAAATGLYGSRAANGVIIITTKSGKSGKTRIDFNAVTGFNYATTGKFKVMNSQQLYDYEKSFYPPDRFDQEVPASVARQNTNWQNLAFRTGLTHNYVLSISGGSEKTRFYVAGNYYNEQGTLRHNEARRYNLRANITHDINDKLKLNIKLNGRLNRQQADPAGLDGALYGAYNNMPWDNPYLADGTPKRGTEGGWFGREQENFLHGWQFNRNEANGSGLDGDINLDYTILPNLTFSSYNRVSYSTTRSELYYDIRSKAGKGLGRLTNGFIDNLSLITSNRLRYDKNFGKHALSALAVAEAEKNKLQNNSVTGEGFAPGLHVMNTASRILSATGSINENSFSKGLVQLDYNFDNKYFAVGSYINESSSRFGADNRSGNFYTLGASWILSNERFLNTPAFLDLLKVRASYGVTGNAEIGNYQSLGLYSFATQYAGNSAAYPFQMDNKGLTWEKAKSLNLGLDVGLYKRLTLNLDVYSKTTDGLLLNVELPYTSGFGSVIRNVGSIRNRGLELNLNSINLAGAFRWETNFNIAFNRSKVLVLDQGKDIRQGNLLISEGQELYTWNMRKWMGADPATGDPLWEKITAGPNGEEIRTTTNAYSTATQQNLGSASPDFTGGLSNTLSYKGFTLFAFFNFVSGNQIYHVSRQLFDSDGAYYSYNSMILADEWNRWEKPGDVATHPKPVFGGNKNSNQASSRYLEDGSYIRLRNISLSYQVPNLLAKKIKSEHLKIFVSGDNLLTFSKFSGMDPEVVLGPSGGLSSIKYPISKKLLFGINIGF